MKDFPPPPTHPLYGLALAVSLVFSPLTGASAVEAEILQYVPAIISPNRAIVTEQPHAPMDISNDAPQDRSVVTLEGVAPHKTLAQLRQAPKVNTAALDALSIESLKTEDKQASLSQLSALQAEISETDLKRLWQATIEHNQIVRFALEKISLPAEHHISHSSEFLRKTMSVLVSGAAMASTAVAPTSGYQNMTVLTGSQVAQNYIGNRHKPISDLSPTEHIQLSYLIDELKEMLVTEYHQYQKSVYALNTLRKTSETEEALYASGQKADAAMDRMMAVQRYFTYRDNLLKVETRAEHARIQLERLAGRQAVDNLALGVRPEASYVVLSEPAPVADPQTPKVIAKDASGGIQLTGKTVGAAASVAPLTPPPASELSLVQEALPAMINAPIQPKAAHRLSPVQGLPARDSQESAVPANTYMELPLMEDVSL